MRMVDGRAALDELNEKVDALKRDGGSCGEDGARSPDTTESAKRGKKERSR